MVAVIRSVLARLVSLFRSRAKLGHEILILRHRLNVLRWAAPRRAALTNLDRWLFVSAYRVWPGVPGAVRKAGHVSLFLLGTGNSISLFRQKNSLFFFASPRCRSFRIPMKRSGFLEVGCRVKGAKTH